MWSQVSVEVEKCCQLHTAGGCTNSSGGGSDENREEALGEEGEDKALDLEQTDPLTRCMTLSKLLHSLSLFPHL